MKERKNLPASSVEGTEVVNNCARSGGKTVVKSHDKRRLEKSNQETENGEQATDERCGGCEGGVTSTTTGSSIVVLGSTGDGVLGLGTRESGVLGGLDVEVRSGVTQALANGLEGKFGVVFQSGV